MKLFLLEVSSNKHCAPAKPQLVLKLTPGSGEGEMLYLENGALLWGSACSFHTPWAALFSPSVSRRKTRKLPLFHWDQTESTDWFLSKILGYINFQFRWELPCIHLPITGFWESGLFDCSYKAANSLEVPELCCIQAQPNKFGIPWGWVVCWASIWLHLNHRDCMSYMRLESVAPQCCVYFLENFKLLMWRILDMYFSKWSHITDLWLAVSWWNVQLWLIHMNIHTYKYSHFETFHSEGEMIGLSAIVCTLRVVMWNSFHR